MREETEKGWSEETKELTRKFVRDRMPAAMKHLDRQYAVMGYRETKIVLFDRTVPGREYLFDSVEELLDAGWVVD